MSFLDILANIAVGINVTIKVTLYGMLYAVPFAFVFGIAQHFTSGVFRLTVTTIIEFWRSSPVIVLIYGFYFSLPSLGIDLSAMTVGAMVLGLNIGGYGSQAVRAALQALDKGQIEAGYALGLRRLQILYLIELPQALAAMTPTFINQFIQLVKGTSLVSLVTLADMTFLAKALSQTHYAPAKIYTALLLVYFLICYPATIVGRMIERRVGRGREVAHEL
ncbi:amino acid ABC transporter permease [Aminobacter aminovorans]|uniref:ABC transporter n=1 Tax=Aminobacter aminovorans TaxID=83263 RepID=A0AAC8YW17_AMIAI|nr:amino acid ABC transporter permease [Aminobacter aminovorans]AMS45049.1 ABC transporter [Aminobacter aminovorans]MBB3710052.1 polar amino acid transport system permease protein [Aminobacter aminovorans]